MSRLLPLALFCLLSPALGQFNYNWEYPAPKCGTGLTVTYPADLPAQQSNDVNIRVRLPTGQQITLNYHNNNGDWRGVQVFDIESRLAEGITCYIIEWVQVAGTNYHWEGSVECGCGGESSSGPAVGVTGPECENGECEESSTAPAVPAESSTAPVIVVPSSTGPWGNTGPEQCYCPCACGGESSTAPVIVAPEESSTAPAVEESTGPIGCESGDCNITESTGGVETGGPPLGSNNNNTDSSTGEEEPCEKCNSKPKCGYIWCEWNSATDKAAGFITVALVSVAVLLVN